MDALSARIVAICLGRIAPLGEGAVPSAIARRSVDGPVRVAAEGLVGDEHADTANHGGPDKALLYYPIEHHAAWRALLPSFAPQPGAFGENLLGQGMLERDVCLGDVFSAGATTLEVSQPRQPCFKLDLHLGVELAARTALLTGRTGFYLRVRSGGMLAAGDPVRLLSRPHPDWPLERARRVYVNRRDDEAEAAHLARLPALSQGWRNRLQPLGA